MGGISFLRGGGAKKMVRLKGSEGETRIWVEGGVLLEGANPHKCSSWFLNYNYKAEFGLK